MLDDDYVHTQASELDSSVDMSNLTQKDGQAPYQFIDSEDEDENAFPFSPIFGQKYEPNDQKLPDSQILYDNVVAEPITSEDERLVAFTLITTFFHDFC